ncbi:MAG TPA: hypothetical protein VMY39_06390, partial [Planctomycetota bacterium]|nr:hypothetical protein [Planctomycetota bacterium]
ALLNRFDPEAPVTAENASAVAEEMIWAKVLGIGDGRYASLTHTRRVIQATILDAVGFKITRLEDPEFSRVRKQFLDAWQKAVEDRRKSRSQ